eukprot:SAG11_NODE_300_length_11057_cov_5.223469_5_plen_112_part_00
MRTAGTGNSSLTWATARTLTRPAVARATRLALLSLVTLACRRHACSLASSVRLNFVCVCAAPAGRVVSGLEVAEKISTLPTRNVQGMGRLIAPVEFQAAIVDRNAQRDESV